MLLTIVAGIAAGLVGMLVVDLVVPAATGVPSSAAVRVPVFWLALAAVVWARHRPA